MTLSEFALMNSETRNNGGNSDNVITIVTWSATLHIIYYNKYSVTQVY